MSAPGQERQNERRKKSVALGRYARNTETAEYIGVSMMTLWRWKRDPRLNFPAPSIINGRDLNNLDEIDEWIKERAVSRVQKQAAM